MSCTVRKSSVCNTWKAELMRPPATANKTVHLAVELVAEQLLTDDGLLLAL